jgi:hypothetical protein
MAMVMALACVGLLTTALTVSGIIITSESRRTNLNADDAQLRQLLLAGEQISQSRLRTAWSGDQILNVDVPQSLHDQGAILTIQLVGPGTVEIEADLPKHRTSQRDQFAQQNADWHVVNADLGN